MELVYPIYLDTPMMMAFLASLEGGIIEEANLEGKTADAKERTAKASLQAKISGILSSFLTMEGGGEIGKKVSESLESQYKSTVRFPHAALFIRLRDILLDQEILKIIDSKDCFFDLSVGDIVEFQGLALPNPTYQIRHSFGQILPIIEPFAKLTETQLDQQLAQLKDAKPNKPIRVGNNEKVFQDQRQINNERESMLIQKQEAGNLVEIYKTLNTILCGFFPEDKIDVLLFKAEEFQVIARVYPSFARDERIQDLHDGHWHCIGKVIGIIDESGKYDLLKGAPIGYLAKDQFPTFASMLNNDKLNIEITDSTVSGPAIIIATLAIFA